MGKGIMIYITDENWESLADIKNRSALINKLLDEYFAVVKSPLVALGHEKLQELKQIVIARDEAEKKIEEVLNNGKS